MDNIRAQLRLRSAFRYGYFAFALAIACLYAVVWMSVSGISRLEGIDLPLLPEILGSVGLGLIVPLFLLAWLVIGQKLMRPAQDPASPSAG